MAERDGRHIDLFVGKEMMYFFGGGGDVDIDAEVEAARALEFVPDQ